MGFHPIFPGSASPTFGSPGMNRLAREKSPYLIHAAEQPIDWYPWGEEAFRLAAARDKPIFLSSGAIWCHWCHVMAKNLSKPRGGGGP